MNIGGIIWIIAIFAVMWFFMIRPQQVRQKKWQQMIDNLKVGDRVVTRGGLYGTIVKLRDDNTLRLQIADDVTVKMVKNGIGYVLSEEDKNEEEE